MCPSGDRELAGHRVKPCVTKAGRSCSRHSFAISACRGKQLCDSVQVSDIFRALFFLLCLRAKAFAVLWWGWGRQSPLVMCRAGSTLEWQQGNDVLDGSIQRQRAAQTAGQLWLFGCAGPSLNYAHGCTWHPA